MFRSMLGMPRWVRLLAPIVAGSVAAGGGVVAVSRATDSTQSQPPVSPAERQGLALQSAFVKVVSSISPSVAEITATGAAYAAGLATGFWSGLDELRANYTTTRRWQPQMSSDDRAAGVAAWRRAVDRTLGLVDTSPGTVGTLSGTNEARASVRMP